MSDMGYTEVRCESCGTVCKGKETKADPCPTCGKKSLTETRWEMVAAVPLRSSGRSN